MLTTAVVNNEDEDAAETQEELPNVHNVNDNEDRSIIINPTSNDNDESANKEAQLINYISSNLNQSPNDPIVNVPMIPKGLPPLMPAAYMPLYTQHNIASLSFNSNPSTVAARIKKKHSKKIKAKMETQNLL